VKKNVFSGIPWWLIITLLFAQPFVGIALLLAKLYGERDVPVKKANDRQKNLRKAGIGMFAFGAILLTSSFTSAWMWLLGGLFAAGMSFYRSKEDVKFRKYKAVIGDRKVVPLAEIAAKMGVDIKTCESDIERMIEMGYYEGLWNPYVDRAADLFVLDAVFAPEPDVSAQPIREEKKSEAKKSEAKKPEEKKPEVKEETISEYEKKLREIRRMNDRIADKRVSAAIEHIESVTQSIFEQVSGRPEKERQIHTFMNYYLPTTLKLLNAYAELEKMPTAGENIVSSRKRIEDMLDRLVFAFDKQLNDLFDAEAKDISSDIRVLETMMARDGITSDGLIMPKTASSGGGKK
jgi:5-bromo-4-chloroindolyl phosphate hydrolysis protein